MVPEGKPDHIPNIFLEHASNILGDTILGLTGAQISSSMNAHLIEWNVQIPEEQNSSPVPNKRSALLRRLRLFTPAQQYVIIRDLCNIDTQRERDSVKTLKLQLITRYGHLANETLSSELDSALVERTRHWLDNFPDALKMYNDASEKYANSVFLRNLLDDLRLSLELLCQQLFGNTKALENQLSSAGQLNKAAGGLAPARQHVREAPGLLHEISELLCKA